MTDTKMPKGHIISQADRSVSILSSNENAEEQYEVVQLVNEDEIDWPFLNNLAEGSRAIKQMNVEIIRSRKKSSVITNYSNRIDYMDATGEFDSNSQPSKLDMNVSHVHEIKPCSKNVTCAYCEEVMSTELELLDHYDKIHQEGLEAVIAKCAQTMSSRTKPRKEGFEKFGLNGLEYKNEMGSISLHQPVGENTEDVACLICYYKFPKSHFHRHVLETHYWIRIRQSERQKRICGTQNLLDDKGTGPFICERCGQELPSVELLCVHMWKAHQSSKYRTMLVPNRAKQVLNGNSPEIVWCPECGKPFKNKHSLACHKSEFHEAGSAERRRRKRASLNESRAKHTFLCDMCSYSTPEARRLNMHVNKVHLGINAYKCPFCTYTTSEQTALRHHKYTHLSEKPLKCNHCGFNCVQKHDIRQHLKRSHGITFPPVKALKHYHKDPTIARQLRQEAAEQQRLHYTESKDQYWHSCRGNEFYDAPYDDTSPNPDPLPSDAAAMLNGVTCEAPGEADRLQQNAGEEVEMEGDYMYVIQLNSPMEEDVMYEAVAIETAEVIQEDQHILGVSGGDLNAQTSSILTKEINALETPVPNEIQVEQGLGGSKTFLRLCINNDGTCHVEPLAQSPSKTAGTLTQEKFEINYPNVKSSQDVTVNLETQTIPNELHKLSSQMKDEGIESSSILPDAYASENNCIVSTEDTIDVETVCYEPASIEHPLNEVTFPNTFSIPDETAEKNNILTNKPMVASASIGQSADDMSKLIPLDGGSVTDTQFYMVEMGLDELGNKRYAVVLKDESPEAGESDTYSFVSCDTSDLS